MAGNESAKAEAMDAQLLARLRRALLRWYRANRRDLPWRPRKGEPADPYRVLVSEAMLQQTQVATAVPYFERFIAACPDVATLAATEEQAVLRLWQGLGYYRRARHLHAAARMIVQRFDGRVPCTVDNLLDLPGVGRYCAGAIASIAFGVRAPILDGNVARVLARWFAVAEPVDQSATRERLWELAEQMAGARARTVAHGENHPGIKPSAWVGDFNQAMMELGAMVCTPRSPRCPACPVRACCAAHAQGLVEELPRKNGKKPPRAVTHHVAALCRGGRYRFVQRGDAGLWAGMWGLPTYEPPEAVRDDAPDNASVLLHDWVKSRLGYPHVDPPREAGRFVHQTTHRTITFVVWEVNVALRTPRTPRGQTWRKLDDLDDLPLPNPQRRAIQMLRRRQGGGGAASARP